MSSKSTNESSDPPNNDTTNSIQQIINTIIKDDTSPISSWLTNVIETYVNNIQQSEPLTINKLFSLTNDMLLTYSITTTQTQSKQFCSNLINLLQTNNHLPQFNEPFPVNTKCNALYMEDNQWYPATIIKIIQPGHSYTIEFDGYGNQQDTTTAQLKHFPEDSIKTLETKKSISLKDSIKITTQKDKDLSNMIMTDVHVPNNGVKTKKYHNDMMELHAVDEKRLAELTINDEDEKNFTAWIDGKTKDDKYGDGMNEKDAEKYTMVDRYGKKKRINPQNDICCVCDRTLPLTWHHLIPKSTHNEYLKLHPNSTRLFLNKHGIWICRQCHSAIHGTYPNKELMKSYWELEMLLESLKIQKWIKYVSKQRVTGHYDRRANKKNLIAQIQSDKSDHSTKIKYIQ